MSTPGATAEKKLDSKDSATENQCRIHPMGNQFLSVAGSTVTKSVAREPLSTTAAPPSSSSVFSDSMECAVDHSAVGNAVSEEPEGNTTKFSYPVYAVTSMVQAEDGTRLQSARPAVQQLRVPARPTTSSSKPITPRSTWRPPLQRTKQTSSLPSIEPCNLSLKPNDLIHCEEQSGEEESDRFRHCHDVRLKRRVVSSAISRRFGVGYTNSPPVTRPLISSKSLPSFGLDKSTGGDPTQETTCVDSLLHEVIRNTPARSSLLTDTWSHSRLGTMRPQLNKRSENHSMEGVLFDECSKVNYGVYTNSSGAYPKVLQPLSTTSRATYSARSTANSESRRFGERTFTHTNKLQICALPINNTEPPSSLVDSSADGSACLTGETLTLKSVSALLELERYVANPDVTKFVVHRIDFLELAPHISKLQSSENLLCLELRETGLKSLRQLESLVQLRNLQCLIIGRGNNPIVRLSTWIPYLVHRMGHLALTTINGKQITTDMMQAAQQMFGPVVQLVRTVQQKRRGSRAEAATQQTLLQRREDQIHEDCSHRTSWPNATLSDAEKEMNCASKEAARYCVEQSTNKCIQSLWKESLAQRTWPLILRETVAQILDELGDIDRHMKTCMAELEK